MPATPITNPFAGEELVGVAPQLTQQVDPAFWRQRLSLFTGRALRDTALDAEQLYRAGLLATLGQAVTPGVVTGLVAAFDLSGTATVTTKAVASGNNVALAVADSKGFQTGQKAFIDSEGNQEQFTVAAIPDGNSVIAATLTKNHAANVGVRFDPMMDPSLGASATAKTTTAVAKGVNMPIAVDSSVGFQTGSQVLIDSDKSQEQFQVVAVPDATHIVADVLGRNHDSGVAVVFEPVLGVTAGYGISASGKDVYLHRDIKTTLSAISVIDPVTGESKQSFADYVKVSINKSFAGILVLQPVVVEATGRTLDTGTSPLIVSGNLSASCDQDPDENAFADLQIVDAARLVFVAWPDSLALPPQAPPETWRNRLVYTIFNAEQALGPDETMPWAIAGVPVALAGFDSSWKPMFLDRGAVVRAGGLPRRNYVVVGDDGAPSLVSPQFLQARLAQFSEQLSERISAAPAVNNLSDVFSTAPPSGIVPASALDFIARKSLWFPPNWDVKASPVHLEELETVLQTGITAATLAVQKDAPADKNMLEPVDVLVPLPDELYDPKILVTETVSEEFQAEIDSATSIRNSTLKNRLAIELETNALLSALGPNLPVPNPATIRVNEGLTPDEIAARDARLPYFPVTSSNSALDESLGVNSPTTWQPNSAYIVGQFIVDPNRNIQIATKAGVSNVTQPAWNINASQVTAETVTTTTVTTPVTAGNNVSIVVANSSGFQSGQQLLIDSGANLETFNVVSTPDATHLVADKLTKNHAANVNVFSNPPTWLNNGPVTLGSTAWQADSAYLVGQLVLDPNGNLQIAKTPGKSGGTEPNWKINQNDVTTDGTLSWTNRGPGRWQKNHKYAGGDLVIDPKGNVQTAQAEGTSGDSQPRWQATISELPTKTARTTAALAEGRNVSVAVDSAAGFSVGQQLLIDADANQERFTVAAIVDATHFTADLLVKSHAPGANVVSTAITPDGSVNWLNNGQSSWLPNTQYEVGQFIVDHNGNLQTVAVAGSSGAAPPTWNTSRSQKTSDGGVSWVNNGSTNWQANAAYVAGQFIFDQNGNLQVVQTAGTAGPREPVWSVVSGQSTRDGGVTWVASTWSSIDIQKILNYPNAFPAAGSQFPLLKAADQQDLLTNGLQHFIDFVNAKISRADDLINLAFLTTQTDIYRYRQNVLGASDASKLATSPILANIATGDTSAVVSENLQTFLQSLPKTTPPSPPAAAGSGNATTLRSGVLSNPVRALALRASITSAPAIVSTVAKTAIVKTGAPQFVVAGQIVRPPAETVSPTSFIPQVRGTPDAPAAPSDISQQQPLVGAQLNLRTLTVAERLAQSRSQEALFYSVSNRLAFLQLLADLDLTIEDLTILVDSASPTPVNPNPVDIHSLEEIRNPNTLGLLLAKVQGVQVPTNADEATLFSNGIRVLEQHSQLLRDLEGRVQHYRDFVTFCTTALSNIQKNLQLAYSSLKKLDNKLLQERQDVTFTSQLLAEEILRVNAINDKRLQILQNSVQVVAYTRGRTLEATVSTPTRQLLPGNVTSPVPSCLQESVAIPPELREIVALLREAPVNWLPAVQDLLNRLERPSLLYEVAAATRSRAILQLQLPQLSSSADVESGTYGPVISSLYYANQQIFRTFTAQRSTFQLSTLPNQSWQSLVGVLQNLAAVGDLIAASAVHAEIVNATSRLMAQISNVATCLYVRMSATDPLLRLAWAEFLRGPGLSLQLRSLSVLPNWTQQEYVDRDQTQMLVDWLFQQIDTSNSAAVAYMSDLVRVCILLASHAPVDNIISSALTVRIKPVIGGLVSLHLPSVRVASGMYVNLYSKGELAAQAVVSDLDAQTVKATVTSVYKTDVYIETTDVAHLTAQAPKALAMRALAG